MENLQEDNILNIAEFETGKANAERFVVFFLDEYMFAVPSKNVAEVDRLLLITPLPNVPDWFMGVSNLRGDIVSVVDLRSFWERKSPSSKKAKTIILRSSKGDIEIAFVVDKLGEIAVLELNNIESLTNPISDVPLLHVYRKVEYKGNDLYLLDAEKLLSSPKLLRLQP